MKKDRKNSYIDVWSLLKQRGPHPVQATFDVAHFPLLADSLASQKGEVTIDALLHTEHGSPLLVGNWKASVEVICQRCMQPFFLELQEHVQLCILPKEDMEQLIEPYDPLVILPDSDLSLIDLLSEEILLALPLVARHEASTCNQFLNDQVRFEPEPEEPIKAFRSLESLKIKENV